MKQIIFSFLFFTNILVAQQYEPFKINFGTDDGLPSSECYEIIQDQKGYIWFGTDRGVVRYNGYEFETFTTKEGMNNNVVFYLFESIDGKVWFYDIENQLSYYENDSIYSYKYNQILKANLNNKGKPIDFFFDDKGVLYLSIYNENPSLKIKRIDINGKCHFYDTSRCEIIFEHTDTETTAYFGRKRNKRLINKKTNQFIYNVCNLNGNYSSSATIVTSLGFHNSVNRYTEEEDKLYFSNSNTLYLLEKGFPLRKVYEFSKGILELEIKDGDLYIGLHEKGLIVFPSGNPDEAISLVTDCSVSGVLVAKDSSLWITTQDRGVYFIPHKYFNIHKESKDQVIVNISGNNGEIIYSDYDGNIYNLKNGDKLKTGLSAPSYIRTIFPVNQKGFLASLISQYSYHYTSLERKPHLIGTNLIGDGGSAARDWCESDSIIYGIFKNRLMQFTNDLKRISTKVISNTRLNCVSKSFNKGALFIGRNDGLFIYSKDSLREVYSNNKPFEARVSDLEFSDSTLFVATRGDGILFYKKDASSIAITKKEGLISNEVDKLAFSKDKLYAASKEGLSLITLRDSSYEILNFTVKNGLISNEINDVYVRNDTIWLATNKGIVMFGQNQSPFRKESTVVYLKSLLINGKRVSLKQNNYFKYNENDLEISYEAISFLAQGKLLYRYRMMGLDHSWKETSSRSLRFPNLPPGDYKFMIQYQNEQLSWSTPSTLFKIEIKKPFWNEFWFLLTVILVFLGLVYLYTRRYIRKINQKITIQKQILDLERRALQAQMNPHFIFNSLTSIQSLISQNKNENAEDFLVTFSRLVRASLNHSTRTFISLEDEITLLNDYLEIESLRFEDVFDWSIKVSDDIEAYELSLPPMMIQPFIENAIDHGLRPLEKKGLLEIEIMKAENEMIRVSINDNGVGRSISKKQKTRIHNSLGVNLVKDRLQLLSKKSSITFIDKMNKNNPAGTTVIIIAPCQKPDE